MTFVLVHGGRLGGWCWRDVKAHLVAAGHEVVTPTLTGVGERAHLARPDVDLDTHIRDLVATIEHEDLHEVVLVGHSYGGAVITGAADHVTDRIARLVYLDAIIPQAGVSAMGVNSAGVRQKLVELAEQQGDGWLVPAPTAEQVLGDAGHPAFAWVAERLTGQPLQTYLQPLASADRAPGLRRAYIRCTAEGNPFSGRFVDEARGDPSWTVRELACGHNAMLLAPAETARILLELAAEPA